MHRIVVEITALHRLIELGSSSTGIVGATYLDAAKCIIDGIVGAEEDWQSNELPIFPTWRKSGDLYPVTGWRCPKCGEDGSVPIKPVSISSDLTLATCGACRTVLGQLRMKAGAE